MRVSVVRDRSTMVLWNIHNFCLGDIEQRVIRPLFAADTVAAAQEPLDFIVFAGGDFNFEADGRVPFRPQQAQQVTTPEPN